MQRLAYSKKEVAQLLSLSVRSVDHFISTGALKAMKANRRVLISADSVKNFIKKEDYMPEAVQSIDKFLTCDPCNKGGGWWKLAALIGGFNHKDKRSVSKFLREKGM